MYASNVFLYYLLGARLKYILKQHISSAKDFKFYFQNQLVQWFLYQ